MKKISVFVMFLLILLSGCATLGFREIDIVEAKEIIDEMLEQEKELESLIINMKKYEGSDLDYEREIKVNLEDDIAYYKENEVEAYVTRKVVEEKEDYKFYEFKTYDVKEKKIYNGDKYNAFLYPLDYCGNTDLRNWKNALDVEMSLEFTFYKNSAGSLKCVREKVFFEDTLKEETIFNKKGQVLQSTTEGNLVYNVNTAQIEYDDVKYTKKIKYKKPRIKLPNTKSYSEA